MDEPLSNLDAKLRVATRAEIVKLHSALETTFVYVTHDQTEAMTMGTRIVVMKDGRIQQVDTPKNLYDFPANKFVAEFIGSPQMNVCRVEVEVENGSFLLGSSRIQIADRYHFKKPQVYVGFRPEDITVLEPGCPGNNNTFEAKVDLSEELGSHTNLYFTVEENDKSLIANLNSGASLQKDGAIKLALDTSKLHFFDIDTEQRIGMA